VVTRHLDSPTTAIAISSDALAVVDWDVLVFGVAAVLALEYLGGLGFGFVWVGRCEKNYQQIAKVVGGGWAAPFRVAHHPTPSHVGWYVGW